jgi:RHH-type transcriptional regulator, proline utilization regulon repressor / proline dehydrogenase / delta 1-pyrroline-5-carboxylate dehydrogenase
MEPARQKMIIERAITLAESWQNRANALLTIEEKAIQKQMKRLLTHPLDKVILTRLIDQSFRSHHNSRVADQVNGVLAQYGAPDFFSRVEKLLLQMFQGMGRYFPDLLVPKMIEKMRDTSSRAIIPGELGALHAHLKKRKSQGIRMNINHLGEAVLGEAEVRRRLETYLRDLEDPEIEYISVKISTIYSQISSLAFSHTVAELVRRLSTLYQAAQANYFTRPNGVCVPKFVNLDMEEYRDLEITYQSFIQTLDQEAFKSYSAGIVLQAYLPDSHLIQKDLTAWAKNRVTSGGAPVKLRIVKGANMEMELLESSLNNWPQAPYDNKLEVDANYKRMVSYGMRPENITAVNLGIASHNLFELAYAKSLAEAYRVEPYFYFEMLEGMADHVRRALSEGAGDVLLYAPVAAKEEFINAIAYLIRRLDENTTPGNFLRAAPGLVVGTEDWNELKQAFIDALAYQDRARLGPSRTQDRNMQIPGKTGTFYENTFTNEPDTDWSLPANRRWAEGIRLRWKKEPGAPPVLIPLVVAGEERFSDRDTKTRIDPNRYAEKIVISRCALATEADVADAVAAARRDQDGWREIPHRRRHEILSRVAEELRKERGNLIGAAAVETGKVFAETDVEVSEAIDFAEYYPYAATAYQSIDTVSAMGRGVGLVISPWNFPVAIPCGGITAALAAGNTVIFKPASDAMLTAWVLCNCFWRAGVSKRTLQFVPCTGTGTGAQLAAHPDIDFVILTGGTDTGLTLLKESPGIYLAAETGGKNASIVTDMADRDQAIKNVLHSAFSNGGQKCSATSLLILEQPVYEDAHFKQQLVDAACSFHVGSAWDFENKMGPLLHPPEGSLHRALTILEPEESWALKPSKIENNPHLWTPGIKYGVQPGSFTHMTEFFGPVLGVMCASSLDHAISLVNATGYGLTSGIESLDQREQGYWKDRVLAGNLYINRGTTGAITLRQPFGGMGKSALGPGIKAGGPDYVAQFFNFRETGYPMTGAMQSESRLLKLADEWHLKLQWGEMAAHREDIHRSLHAIRSYLYHAENKFSKELDSFHLRGQDNILRYLPIGKMVIRVHPNDSLFEVLARIAAALIAGCDTLVSIPAGMDSPVTGFLSSPHGKALTGEAEVVFQSDEALIDMIPAIDRIRYAAPERSAETVLAAAARTGFFISRTNVMMDGRIELLQYYRQQAICNNYHRYGNLGERGLAEN